MKKLFLFPVMLLFALTIAACSNSPNGFEEPDTEQPKTSGNDDDEDNKPEENSMKIKITVGNREVTATMKDNVTTRDFLSRLPIEVTMNDYAGAEKAGGGKQRDRGHCARHEHFPYGAPAAV